MNNDKSNLELWSEVFFRYNEIWEQLEHVRFSLEGPKKTKEEIKHMNKDISEAGSKINELEKFLGTREPQGRAILRNNSITSNELLQSLKEKHETLLKQVNMKKSQIDKSHAELKQFLSAKKQHASYIQALEAELEKINTTELDPDGACSRIIEIRQKLSNERQKGELRSLAKGFVLDQVSVETSISKAIAELEASYDRLELHIDESESKWKSARANIERWRAAINALQSALAKGKHALKQLKEARWTISRDLDQDLNQARTGLEVVTKAKSWIELLENLVSGVEQLPPSKQPSKDLNAIKTNHIDIYNQLESEIQTAQIHLTLWHQVEEIANDITTKLANWYKMHSIFLAADLPERSTQLNILVEDLPKNINESLSNFDNKLLKLNEIEKALSDSSDGNRELITIQKSFHQQLDEIKKITDLIRSDISALNEKAQLLRDRVKELDKELNEIRDSGSKCEDLTGDLDLIINHLLEIRKLKQRLANFASRIEKILDELKRDTKGLEHIDINQMSGTEKRLENVKNHINRIEYNLITYIMKNISEKMENLNRNLVVSREKLNWCTAEPGLDRGSIEAQLSSVGELMNDLDQTRIQEPELARWCSILGPDGEQSARAHAGFLEQLGEVKKNCQVCVSQLSEQLSHLAKFEQALDKILAWLKQNEPKARELNILTIVELNNLENKLKESNNFHSEVLDFKKNIEQIEKIADEVNYRRQINQAVFRYKNLLKYSEQNYEMLNKLLQSRDIYNSSINEVISWLTEAENKMSQIENTTTQNKGQTLNVELETGQRLIQQCAEASQPLLVLEKPRSTIREQVRELRGRLEGLVNRHERVRRTLREAELSSASKHGNLAELSELTKQLRNKFNRISEKVVDKPFVTLTDIKLSLNNLRSIKAEIALQLPRLENACQNAETSNDAEHFSKELKSINEEAECLINQLEPRLLELETLIVMLENGRDLITALSAAIFADINEITEGLENEKAQTQLLMNEISLKMETINNRVSGGSQTQAEQAELGSLNGQVSALQADWQTIVTRCSELESQREQLKNRRNTLIKNIKEINDWLTKLERKVRLSFL